MKQAAWWKFNGNGDDNSGRRNSIDTSNQTFVDGKYQQAIDCDGSTIDVPWNDDLVDVFSGKEFTISFWIRQQALPTDSNGNITAGDWNDYLMFKDVDGAKKRFERWGNDSHFGLWANIGNNRNASLASHGSDPLNEYHHIVIRRISGLLQLWINGEKRDRVYVDTEMVEPDTSIPIRINHEDGYADMDDLRLFDKAVSRRQIQDLANAPVAKYSLSRDVDSLKNLWNHTHSWTDVNGGIYEYRNDGSIPTAPYDDQYFYVEKTADESAGESSQWHASSTGSDMQYYTIANTVYSFSGWYKLNNSSSSSTVNRLDLKIKYYRLGLDIDDRRQ